MNAAHRFDHVGDRLIRMAEVEFITSLSRPTIYRRMRDGTFPQGIKPGGSETRWLESEVRAWLAQAISNRTIGPANDASAN